MLYIKQKQVRRRVKESGLKIRKDAIEELDRIVEYIISILTGSCKDERKKFINKSNFQFLLVKKILPLLK